MESSPLHDMECRTMIGAHPGAGIAWFLMASYCYYHEDRTLLSDGMFDELARFLAQRWNDLDHPHKHLISLSDLEAGTGYALPKTDYPLIAISAALRLLNGPTSQKSSEPPPLAGQLALL